MKLLIISAILFLCLISDAREPVNGDYVGVWLSDDLILKGNITNISDSLICLENGTMEQNSVGGKFDDICVGIGQIRILSWPAYSWAT